MISVFTEGVHYEVDANGCHQWLKTTTHDGYAQHWNGSGRTYAHRFIWEAHNGTLGADMTVDHLCFSPGCVNLAHLRELDRLTNCRLQRSATKTHCVHGHEYTPENTYRRPDNNHRQCAECKRERVRQWRARRKAAKSAA